MYDIIDEFCIRESLYGNREERKKNEIIRLMRYYKDSIPKPIKLSPDLLKIQGNSGKIAVNRTTATQDDQKYAPRPSRRRSWRPKRL